MEVAMSDGKTIEVGAAVQLPSADLIQYRFDNIDNTLEKFDHKLDKLANTYVPRTEIEDRLSRLNAKIDALGTAHGKLKETDDFQQGAINANRRFVAISLIILGIIVPTVTTYLVLHK